MILLTIMFGLLSGCLLSVLVGILGSRRRIGFGCAFLASLILSPLGGLIITLLSDPRPDDGMRWGCIGTGIGILGFLFLIVWVVLLALLLSAA
ncbi:MAG: hypothetical protein RRY33_02155 [Alistipes sp.]